MPDCNSCSAQCCRVIHIFQGLNEDQIKWWEYRGFKPVKVKGNFHRIEIPIPCTKLEGNRCSVYEERPKQCRDFDCEKPEYMFERK